MANAQSKVASLSYAVRPASFAFVWVLAAIAGLALASPEATAGKVNKEIDKCLEMWVPPGAKDGDLKWYNPQERCEANSVVPNLDERRCETVVKDLARLSRELNASVEEACKKYIPELVADGCELKSRDPHCIEKMQELLRRASAQSSVFDTKLDTFIERLVKLRKISLEGADKIYRATLYSEQRDRAIDDANRHFQKLTGDATAKDFAERNGRQASAPLKEVISNFSNHSLSGISGTDMGTAAGQSALSQRAAGLDKAWRSLDQKVPSPLAYEQLVNTLDAEETWLRTQQYKNDLKHLRAELQTMHDTNAETLARLKHADGTTGAGPAAGSAAKAAGALASAAGANSPDRAASSSNGLNAPDGESPSLGLSFSPVRSRGKGGYGTSAITDVNGSPAAKQNKMEAKRSGSSSYRGGLRDALRNRLARGYAEKESSASSPADVSPGILNKEGNAGAGTTERSPANLAATAEGFGGEGELSHGGFSLGGAEHDEFVEGILANFEAVTQKEQGAPATYIGSLDSGPLFQRVRLFHERYQREGRVGRE